MRTIGFVVSLVTVVGCGAQLGGGNDAPDAALDVDARALDAPPAIDAPPPPACVEGDTRLDTTSGCFAAFLTPRTRVDARGACGALGMHLAFVRSAADEATIASLASGMDVAIGLGDELVEGAFAWDDGTPLGAYTDWHVGEPNNGGNVYEEDCVVYAGARVGSQWDDRPCAPPPVGSGAYAYICQR
ncbi:MAG: C-type lectin domain-containing protein [Proteobacteria bacterium]|nr:C-type lectin domain-containing protein [Pseudomonadota bacterium]